MARFPYHHSATSAHTADQISGSAQNNKSSCFYIKATKGLLFSKHFKKLNGDNPVHSEKPIMHCTVLASVQLRSPKRPRTPSNTRVLSQNHFWEARKSSSYLSYVLSRWRWYFLPLTGLRDHGNAWRGWGTGCQDYKGKMLKW